jgi:hypothetical protein
MPSKIVLPRSASPILYSSCAKREIVLRSIHTVRHAYGELKGTPRTFALLKALQTAREQLARVLELSALHVEFGPERPNLGAEAEFLRRLPEVLIGPLRDTVSAFKQKRNAA